jgi:hypothetical protein
MKRVTTVAALLLLLAAVRYAPALDEEPIYIDLQPKANQKLSENFHNAEFQGNNLLQLPKGESVFEGTKFKIEEKLVQLGCKYVEDRPEKVEGIKVERKFAKLYLLHATGFGAFGNPGDALHIDDGTAIARYTVRYEDNSEEIIPVVYGEDVRDWFNHDQSKPAKRGKVVWEGENDFARQFSVKLRLYRSEWKNPKPDKKVVSIDFERQGDSVAAPFCVAMTLVE